LPRLIVHRTEHERGDSSIHERQFWIMREGVPMERAVLVYTTWPSMADAEKAGREIVERRLAACVNILPRV
jgi:hypothetical protein